MSVHLVLYSNGEPYGTTKKLSIETIPSFTSRKVIIHDYNLEKIKELDWFVLLKDLPLLGGCIRDGYYNAWKPLIVRDVFNQMEDNDILYYVDCSSYNVEGFTQNIDRLLEVTDQLGAVAGSIGYDVRNNSFNCCDNIDVWNKIIPNNNNSIYLDLMHVLNSWFLLKKNNTNKMFVDEWVYFSFYKDEDFTNPLLTYHHTVDQSIFNILTIKYKLHSFYSENITHYDNKNKNIPLYFINNTENISSNFVAFLQ